MRKSTAAVAEALAVTIEACGAELSEAAVRIMLSDLADYPEDAVLQALKRTRREHKGRLSLAAIVERIDDGRPGVEVAWAMVPRSESTTAVLTDEMLAALAAAQPLLNDGDEIAARMAFKEAYTAAVERARADRVTVRWQASIGWDAAGRVQPLADAVKHGRIPLAHAETFVQGEHLTDLLAIAGVQNHPALAAPKAIPPRVRAALAPKSTPTEAEPPERTDEPARKWGPLYTGGAAAAESSS